MTTDEIGCIITCIEECGQQKLTSALVYEIARILDSDVTFKEVIDAMRHFKVNID